MARLYSKQKNAVAARKAKQKAKNQAKLQREKEKLKEQEQKRKAKINEELASTLADIKRKERKRIQQHKKRALEKAKRMQEQEKIDKREANQIRKNYPNLSYYELLATALSDYLLTRPIVGKNTLQGIRETSVNIATKIGLYNTKFNMKSSKTFCSIQKDLLTEFFAQHLTIYLQQTAEKFTQYNSRTQQKIVKLLLEELFSSFNQTQKYFFSSYKDRTKRQIENFTNLTVEAEDLLLLRIKQDTKQKANKLPLNQILDNAYLLTPAEIDKYVQILQRQCINRRLSVQDYYFKINDLTRREISSVALFSLIHSLFTKHPEDIIPYIINFNKTVIMQCKFFKYTKIRPLQEQENKTLFPEDLPSLKPLVATHSILQCYQKFLRLIDNTRGTDKQKYKTFSYQHYSQNLTLEENYALQINKTLYLIFLAIFVYPSPDRTERKYATSNWGEYFFTAKDKFYSLFIPPKEYKHQPSTISDKQITLQNLQQALELISKICTPIFFPLDFKGIYQNFYTEIKGDFTDQLSNPEAEEQKLTFKKAQELLIQNVVNIQGENIFTQLITMLEDFTLIIEKYLKTQESQDTQSAEEEEDEISIASHYAYTSDEISATDLINFLKDEENSQISIEETQSMNDLQGFDSSEVIW